MTFKWMNSSRLWILWMRKVSKIIMSKVIKRNTRGAAQREVAPRNSKRAKVQVEEEYEVEAILDTKNGVGKSKLYLIKWKGYPDSENTWEPSGNIDKSLIQRYEQALSSFKKYGTLPQKQTQQAPMIPTMIGQTSIKQLLSNPKLERDYNSAIHELQESQRVLYMSYTHLNRPPQDDSKIKDWALGSFSRYGDKPFQIIGLKNEGDKRLYVVDWKMRRDGFKPMRSLIEEAEMKEADPDMMLQYIEKFLEFKQL